MPFAKDITETNVMKENGNTGKRLINTLQWKAVVRLSAKRCSCCSMRDLCHQRIQPLNRIQRAHKKINNDKWGWNSAVEVTQTQTTNCCHELMLWSGSTNICRNFTFCCKLLVVLAIWRERNILINNEKAQALERLRLEYIYIYIYLYWIDITWKALFMNK